MLKKEFSYTDYEGNEKTLTAYFHLNKNDCIDLNEAFREEGGLIEYLKTLINEVKNNPDLQDKEPFIRFVRLLVTKSYGERPKSDPSLFLKEDDMGRPLVRKFKGTPAYDDFVFGLLSGKEDLAAFCDGIMPKMDDAQQQEAEKLLAAEGINIADFRAEAEKLKGE